MRWTPEMVARAADVFRKHVDYHVAFDEVQRTVRVCSASGLRGVFKGRGIPSPIALLRPVVLGATAPAEVPRPPSMPTNVAPTPCEPEPMCSGGASVTMPCSAPSVECFRAERILFVPDAHFPYEDKGAWQMLLRVGRFFKPDRIVVLGDFADMYSVSSHSKSPARASLLVAEMTEVHRGLDDLDSLGAERKHLLLGNHEWRLGRLILNQAPALHGLECLDVAELFELPRRGWTSTKYLVEHRIGSLRISHDYGQAGPYALKRAVMATDSDTMIGHTHRLQEYVDASRKTGQTIRGYSLGWLGKFEDLDYIHHAIARRDWAHGCGVGWTRPDGSVRVECVRFLDQLTTVDGQRL